MDVEAFHEPDATHAEAIVRCTDFSRNLRNDSRPGPTKVGTPNGLTVPMPAEKGRRFSMKLTRNRNLYNADCNTIFYTPELWQPEGGRFSAKAVHRFVDTLADGGVDTLLINPN